MIRAHELINELETEFMNLNTCLEKEGRKKITASAKSDFMRFESWLSDKKEKGAD
jgi:hypothetical protein